MPQAPYNKTQCQKRSLKLHKKSSMNFCIKELDERGKSFVANKKIKSGELIFKEKAEIALNIADINETNVYEVYQNLSPENQKKFDELTSKSETASKKYDIFVNNGINIDCDTFGIFLTISRVNHSCAPNAAWGSTNNKEELEIRAICDIEENTEICVDYIGDRSFLMNMIDRKKLLEDTWGFDCSCDRCSSVEDESVLTLLAKISVKLKEKLCIGDFSTVYKLHNQKRMTMSKMKFSNHQEMLNNHQVNVLLSVISNQSANVIAKALSDWEESCLENGLFESRNSYEDLARSFKNGQPKHKLEFFDENNCVRKEWIQWIYQKI